MKKLTFNSTFEHKSPGYAPYQIEVEKVITLYGREFEKMRDCPINDNPYIIEHSDFMYMDRDTAHCLLFLDANGNDGILVEAEGADYARKSQFIPNARAIIEQNDLTDSERKLHAELKAMADRIAELAHTGQETFIYEDVESDTNLQELMIQAVAEMLDRRADIAQAKAHFLGIWGQPDFSVIAKPTMEMKFYRPLVIRAEPQYDEDEDFNYDDYEVIPSSCAGGCEDEINAAIEKYFEPNEKYRGLMVYYDEDSLVNEKVVSAFPSVEVRNGELVGVLTCQITEALTDSEMDEFKRQWEGQCSDGWGEGFEQREIKTDAFGTIYVSFWNSSDSWHIEAEMTDTTDTADIEEEESLDMGGISMYRGDYMRGFPSEKEVERLRHMYPTGTRIVVNSMDDPYHPIAPGTKGTVKFVDDAGTIHCTFDNGCSFGVIPGEDGFHKIGMEYEPTQEQIDDEDMDETENMDMTM